MSKTKKLLALVLSLLMLLALLAACGNEAAPADDKKEDEKKEDTKPADDKKDEEKKDEEKKDEEPADGAKPDADGNGKYKAYMVLQDSGGAAWGSTRESFLRGIEAKGWDYGFMSPVTVNSVPEMITLCENAISQGDGDVLITACVDGDMWSDVLLRARAQGMTVVGIVRPPEFKEVTDVKAEDLINACVGFTTEDLARVQAEAIDKIVPKDVKMVAVMFHVQVSDQIQRNYDCLVEEVNKLRPDTEWFPYEADDNNPSKAADKIAALKLAHPELNVIFGQDMGTAMGIHNYVAEHDCRDEMYTVGVDASSENLGAVRDGTVDALIEQGYAHFGEDALDVAEQILLGKDFNYYYVATMLTITPDNVEQVASELNLEIADL